MPKLDNSFHVNHVCIHIKDPKVSIPFYKKNFGLEILFESDFPEAKFSIHFLGFVTEKTKHDYWSSREGLLELRYIHGSDTDTSYELNSGNEDKDKGFSRLGLSFDNLDVVAHQLLSNNVKFLQNVSLNQSNVKLAVIEDPNGYHIYLFENGEKKKHLVTDSSTYKVNHIALRVKDIQISLEFYEKVFGLQIFSKSVFEDSRLTTYYLGYLHDKAFVEGSLKKEEELKMQSIIALDYFWGTENDPSFDGYHNGFSTEGGVKQGFGHICIVCDNPVKFCEELEREFDQKFFYSKWNQYILKHQAYIKDPDGYLIELISPDWFLEWNTEKLEELAKVDPCTYSHIKGYLIYSDWLNING